MLQMYWAVQKQVKMADIEKYTPHSERFINNDAVPACNMTAEIIADTKMYIDNKLSG